MDLYRSTTDGGFLLSDEAPAGVQYKLIDYMPSEAADSLVLQQLEWTGAILACTNGHIDLPFGGMRVYVQSGFKSRRPSKPEKWKATLWWPDAPRSAKLRSWTLTNGLPDYVHKQLSEAAKEYMAFCRGYDVLQDELEAAGIEFDDVGYFVQRTRKLFVPFSINNTLVMYNRRGYMYVKMFFQDVDGDRRKQLRPFMHDLKIKVAERGAGDIFEMEISRGNVPADTALSLIKIMKSWHIPRTLANLKLRDERGDGMYS